jgi:2-dehydropantoate 2-reductase
MEILVYGAGAVGCYLGARLMDAGHRVTLIARGAAAESITENGLTLIHNDHQISSTPEIVTSLRLALAEEARYDQILVCMKAYDAEAALNEMAAFGVKSPSVITFQNGVGVEELFAGEFGPENVIAASLTTPLSNETYHSIVVERSGRGLALAPVQRGRDISQWVGVFQEAGITTVGLKDYRSMKWSKMLVNMVGNPTSAILNRHPKLVYSYGPMFKIEMEMLKETLAVMKKLKHAVVDLPGVSTGQLAFAVRRLPKGIVKPFLTAIVGRGRGDKMPSFHLDLMSGKSRNEVEFHNAAVVAAGREVGLPTPVNQALTEILLQLVRSEVDYHVFNGQPKRLVAEVEKYRQAAKGKRPRRKGDRAKSARA